MNRFNRKKRLQQQAKSTFLTTMVVGTVGAIIVSAFEMFRQLSWTHDHTASAALAGIVIILINLVFVSSHSLPGMPNEIKWISGAGVALLTSVEVMANYIQGGIVAHNGGIPAAAYSFLPGSEQALAVFSGLFFGAVFPILTLACSFCLTLTLREVLKDDVHAVNPLSAATLAGGDALFEQQLDDILAAGR